MKGKIKKLFEILLPICLSAGLILWMFHKVNFREVVNLLRSGIDYGWLILVMGIVVMSHVFRGIRWGYQLRAAGVGNIPKLELCCSIFGAYSLNLAVPYMGEAWRIIYISRTRKAPVTTVLGTDLGDRISDAIVVLCLLVLALVVGHTYIYAFMDKYSVGVKIKDFLGSGSIWLILAGMITSVAFVAFAFRKKKWLQKFKLGVKRIWNGFKVLFTMRGKWQYLLLTLGIWGCYFMETYVGFMAFPETRELMHQPGMAFGLLPGLISFVFSSMSMIVPSNGGLGPWNLAVMFALSLFGIPDASGAAFSVLLWSTVTVTLILLGLFTISYIFYQRHKKV